MTAIIGDHALDTECERLASDIFDEIKAENCDQEAPWTYDPKAFGDEMMERAHEAADGHQWVIYTHYALSICAHANTDQGEQLVDDIGAPVPFSLASVASLIAYGEMRARIETEIQRLVDDYEAPDWPEETEETATPEQGN